MPIFKLNNASLAYGNKILLDQVSLEIYAKNRIGLLGRNGAGKSSLLKIILDDIQLDSGERWIRNGIKISSLAQELLPADECSVFDVIADGLDETGQLIRQYNQIVNGDLNDKALELMGKLQQKLDACDGWTLQNRIETIITQLDLPSEQLMSSLSGGWRRRVALGKALVSEPEILLLDEPTNHLDIPTIQWLEKQLKDYPGAILLITHDRAFLQAVSNRIWEIDRGKVRQWDKDYQSFLVYRDQELHAEEKTNELFDKKLAKEEVWIRQGIKARRTRNEGRVRALKQLRSERSDRRDVLGKAKLELENSDQSGKIVSELENVHIEYDGHTIIDNFSCKILRGDKIGLVGGNGAGKTTLVKAILGEIDLSAPNSGSIKVGTKLDIAYFDQQRRTLNPEQTVIDSLGNGSDFVEINGKQKHVISYLQDFLFPPERTRQPIKALSGGEQNRLILARLFSKPANLLVLDEPTNDLDMETLELLEDLLLNYKGTLLLVSHDRKFMDNVVTSIIVFEDEKEGKTKINEYIGGFSDW